LALAELWIHGHEISISDYRQKECPSLYIDWLPYSTKLWQSKTGRSTHPDILAEKTLADKGSSTKSANVFYC